jgi:hypothetical protein
MPERKPKTEKLSATDVKQRIDDVLGRVTRDRTRAIVRADEPVPPGEFDGPNDPPFFPEIAAVVPIQDLWRLQALEAGRLESFDALAAFGRAFEDVPLEELEREISKAVAEVRQENRERRAAVTTT